MELGIFSLETQLVQPVQDEIDAGTNCGTVRATELVKGRPSLGIVQRQLSPGFLLVSCKLAKHFYTIDRTIHWHY